LRCRQQLHKASLGHVPQKLVAQFLNALIGIEAEGLFGLWALPPEIFASVFEPKNAGRGVGRQMLAVFDLRYLAVLVAENLNGIVLLAGGSSIQTADNALVCRLFSCL
jgi:hypothetical protein